MPATLLALPNFLGPGGLHPMSSDLQHYHKDIEPSSLANFAEQEHFFLFLDDEKAFDRVAWYYLAATLSTIGLLMCGSIQALYSNPLNESMGKWPLIRYLLLV